MGYEKRITDMQNHANPPKRRPEWLKVRLGSGENFADVRRLIREKNLHTVCESARCPNVGECFNRRTATFMILGDVCSRNCRFCNVQAGKPAPPDLDEPERVADAVAELKLKHAVVTSVTRDDLHDGGADIFARTVRAIREKSPDCSVEILIPDFQADERAFERVLRDPPDILNHNLETVARLYDRARPQADYRRSLDLVTYFKRRGLRTKSGLMAGLGETDDELYEAMRHLREAGCDILTVGQYLQPTKNHLPVERYVTPDTFAEYRRRAAEMGFLAVEAEPLVRSSYHADKHAE
ncbi:MAG: lipoyl synthase [Ignavibacteriales bacterium]|nr:lipoyl synthase [Ignavibacteriales bacterium]